MLIYNHYYMSFKIEKKYIFFKIKTMNLEFLTEFLHSIKEPTVEEKNTKFLYVISQIPETTGMIQRLTRLKDKCYGRMTMRTKRDVRKIMERLYEKYETFETEERELSNPPPLEPVGFFNSYSPFLRN